MRIPIPRRASSASAPLSFGQEQLWFLEKIHPDTAAYNVPDLWRLRGPLDVGALRGALRELIGRQTALRTVFALEKGRMVQRLLQPGEITITVEQIPGDTAAERELNARQWVNTSSTRPFNLSVGPLFIAQILCVQPDEHLLLMVSHHAVTDGASLGVLHADLAALYEAGTTGKPPALEDLPVNPRDFAAWQRGLDRAVFESDLNYWRHQLAEAPGTPLLPADRPRPSTSSLPGARVETFLPPATVRQLNALAHETTSSSFMIALALAQLWLVRYTGHTDVIVGTPASGRDRIELQNLVGFFVNMLAVRLQLDGKATFRQLLATARRLTLEAYEHQQCPFDMVVRELHPARSGASNPFFQVAVLYERAVAPSLNLRGLTCVGLPTPTGTSKFDLTITFKDEPEGLKLMLEYSTDLFHPATGQRMLELLRNLAVQAAASPDHDVLALEMLTDDARRRMLEEQNRTFREYPRHACIHSLFEEQARRRPDAVALTLEGRSWSYRQLDERANALAHKLRGLGVKPDTLVAVCMHRSVELIISLLGILKAGGAYVPLAPDDPADRLAFMLEDTGATILLTQEHLQSRLPPTSATVIALEGDLAAIRSFPTSAPPCEATATHLAYVMYTSGSTGRPKGVMIPHRGVVRLVRNTGYAVFAEEDVFLQFAPVSFDASTLEIWAPLLNGGRLVLMPAGHQGLDALGKAIRQHGVTTLWLSAGLFTLMVDERPDDLRGVKQLLSGGDVLSPPHVKRAYAKLPGCRIINGYGPTENTTFTCCHTVEAADLAGSSIPIGVPIANTQVYVLDANLRLVPHGVVGELYTGGDGLARGYLNRTDLTAERFVPNPFGADPESRLYKTGDRCRSREDGTIEFLGRLDEQVKVRGFRVEPGEIESCLAGHPTVRQCVVVALGERLDDKRLVAYYTVHAHAAASPESLNAYLTSRLPGHMVPSALIPLQSLPLTANGKIDRRALPLITSHPPVPENSRHDPVNPEEKKMAALWSQTLRVKEVGRHDNFFALGGNSLLALKLFERIHKSFSCHLPLASLFEFPTVSQLVRLLHSEEDHQRLRSSLVRIRPEGNLAPFFCVHGGGGEVLFGRDLARSLQPGIPFYGLQAGGLGNPAERHRSIEDMAAHYIEAIQSVIAEGPIHLGGYCMGGLVAYEMARRLRGQGLKVRKLILIDTHHPAQVARWQEHVTPLSLWIQKIGFQIRNIIRLSPRKQLDYFLTRSHSAATRRFVWLWNTLTSLLPDKARNQEPTPVDSVRNEAFNAEISQRYLPEPIDVDTVLFRPEGGFRGLDDPKMGWGDLVQGRLEVVTIPVSPGGMLFEPFVGILGQEISKRVASARLPTDRS